MLSFMREKEKIIRSGRATRLGARPFSVENQGGLLWWGKWFPYEHPGEKKWE